MSQVSEPIGLRLVGTVNPGVRAALASVPAWFRPGADTTVPHAAWVNAGAGWADDARTALADGALAVLVDGPGNVSPAELAGFADLPVVLVGSRTHAPQVRALAGFVTPQVQSLAWVEVLVVDGSTRAVEPAAALWDTIAMLTAAGIGIDSVPQVSSGAGVMTADTTAGPARVHLSHVHRGGTAPRASIKAFGNGWSAQAAMGDPLVAFPGEVFAVGAEAATLAISSYETPRRVALREAHSALTGGQGDLPGRTNVHSHATYLVSQVVWDDSQSATQLKWKETD